MGHDDAALRRIEVDLSRQELTLFAPAAAVVRYSVSTALNGPGELANSECTPRGRHVVRARIGSGLAVGAVLRGRRPTGEIYTPELAARYPDRDWILTRILWLSGCEPGRNRLGAVDSMRRYIYIHGTSEEDKIGQPASIGCIRMLNKDIVELYRNVKPGCEVNIIENV